MDELVPLLLNIVSPDLLICLHGDAVPLIFKSSELSDQLLLLLAELRNLLTQRIELLTGYLGWGGVLWDFLRNNRDLGLL